MKKVIKENEEKINIDRSGKIELVLSGSDERDKKRLIVEVSRSDLDIDLTLFHFNNSSENVDIEITIVVHKEARNCKVDLSMRGIITDERSSITFSPCFELENNTSIITHSTSVGYVHEKWSRYLNSRGLEQDSILELLRQGLEED